MNQFDTPFNRSQTGTRKWNPQLLQEKIPEGTNIIAMDLADIDFECAPSIKQALIERAQLADYSYTFVPDEFYQAVIKWNQDYFDLTLQKEWIRLTFGTISALHNIVQALTNPEESVLIHTPAYAPFAEAIQHNDRKLVCNHLVTRNNRYYIDFEAMEQQIVKYNVKLFILCNPQNPSGRIWSKDELARLAILCQKYRVYIVSDEIHRDIVFRGNTFTSLWKAYPPAKDYSVLCVSPNKGFNLGGLKTSYIVVPSKEIREKIYQRLSANYVTSPHVFAVPAIIAAYNHERLWLEQMVDYVEENHRVVESFVREQLPLFNIMSAESSFLVWLNVQALLKTEDEVKMFFDQINLTIVLGSYFVANGEGYIRLNIGMQRSKILEVLQRMKQAYDQKVNSI